MKKLAVLIGFMVLILTSKAQDDNGFKTIFDNGITNISGFGGPLMSFTVLDGKFAHMMGGGGAVLINKKIFFGGYGYGLTTSVRPKGSTNQNERIEFGNGGFWIGYNFYQQKAIHTTFGVQLGWGEISTHDQSFTKQSNSSTYNTDAVGVITPSAEIEMNITGYFKISVGANYRLVTNIDNEPYKSMNFSGPGVFLTFKFGWFK